MAWVSPRTWSAEAVTAAKMNEISADLDVVGGTTWQTYTPDWTSFGTNPTLGNGSISGWYLLAGGWCEVEIVLTIGSSTTAGTNVYFFSLPVPTVQAAQTAMGGSGLYYDTSTANFYTHTPVRASSGGGTNVSMAADGGRWSATAPVAPATGDVISARFRYRI